MRKRRKKTPEQKEKIRLLKEWSISVKERAGHKCEWCDSEKWLNSHHIIGKRYKPFIYVVENGMCLCAKCHKWGIGYAAHENPLIVFLWLQNNRPLDLDYLIGYMARPTTIGRENDGFSI